MADTSLQRAQLANLARAPLEWLNWRKNGSSKKTSGKAEAEPSKEVLDNLIEAEIIPRLMFVHRDGSQRLASLRPSSSLSPEFSSDDIDRFARQAVEMDPAILVDSARALLNEGATHDDLLLRLLAPTARRLGQMWEEDTADFADVTVGLMKLQRVLDCIHSDAPAGLDSSGNAPSVLLTPAPGEQHTFGIAMVGEFFARSGWSVRCEPDAQSGHLITTVSEHHFDVVGISAFSEFKLKALRAFVQLVRSSSLNPDTKILVGGRLFNDDPTLARRVGADAMATDGIRAVVTAERLIDQVKRVEMAQKL